MAPPADRPPFPVGKLPAARLQALLGTLPQRDPRVLVGPQLGEDAAVLDFGDRCLVVATDPVTFATDRIGWYAVHVNANDVAVLGARPRWFFVTLLLPEGRTSDDLVERIMRDVAATCDELGVTVCGGHTEVTSGLDRPIIVGEMLGEVEPARLVRKSRLRPGDRILLTRGAAIEGTAVLAREKAALLRDRLSAADLERARSLLFEPGISIVDAALTSVEAGRVRALHDPTEGGVLTGLYELAAAAGTGLRVFGDRVPVLPETRAVCDALGLDPLRLLASGALLVGVPPEDGDAVAAALAARGIPATVVAEARPAGEGLAIETPTGREPLAPADRDEIARVFESP